MKFIVIVIIVTIAYFEVSDLINHGAYFWAIFWIIIAAGAIYLSSWLIPNGN